LLPLPWWGPVIAPVSIALLMILWGTLAVGWNVKAVPANSEWKAWSLNFIGVGVALYVFMADSISVAGQGVGVLRTVLPTWFNWPLFSVALVLMAAPILQVLWHLRKQGLRNRNTLDYARWINHFVRNREHRPEPDWNVPIEVRPPQAKPALIR